MVEQPIVGRRCFGLLTDQFRSPHLWRSESGRWSLRDIPFESGTQALEI